MPKELQKCKQKAGSYRYDLRLKGKRIMFMTDIADRDPFCDPLALPSMVFYRLYCARRVLYVIETTL